MLLIAGLVQGRHGHIRGRICKDSKEWYVGSKNKL
jgi:hypothetical protein